MWDRVYPQFFPATLWVFVAALSVPGYLRIALNKPPMSENKYVESLCFGYMSIPKDYRLGV